MKHGYVLDVRVLDVVQNTGVLSNAAHADAVSTITPEILYVDVARVGLGAEAVVADIDPSIGDTDAFDIVGVPTICVLGKRGDVVGDGFDADVIVRDVIGVDKEIRPAWRIQELYTFNGDLSRVVREEENRSEEDVVGIENLLASKGVVPGLAIPIESTLSVDADLITAPNPESD